MKKLVRIALMVVASLAAVLLLLVVFGTLFGGCAAKNYVNSHGEELLGRRMNVEGAGVNLFTGHVKVDGLTVYEDDGETLFAGFESLDVGVSLLRLIGKTVYVRHVTLTGLDVELQQDGNRFNFASIIEHFQQDSTETEEPEDTVPSSWVVSLHDMQIVRGKLNYTDVQRQSHWGMNDLNLTVPDFTIGGSENTDAGLTLSFDDGGQLSMRAAMNPADNHFDLTVGLEGFALDQVRPYIVNVANVDRLHGHLAVEASASGSLDSLMNASFKVKANVGGVELSDKDLGTVAKMKSLRLDVEQIVPGKNIYNINKVEIDGLQMKYELFSDSSNTLSRLLVQEVAADSAAGDEERSKDEGEVEESPVKAQPLRLRLGHVALTDIDFTFADHTLPDDFEFAVTDLRLTAENVSTAGRNNARMLATLPSGGKAIVDWEGDISNWKQFQKLRLNIKGLHLTDLSPYMVAYFGMPFSDGVFSFTSMNTINNSKLKGDNRIDIFKPTLGEKRSDVKPKLKLPVKAALYVLKDKDEKVFLPVPVSGDVDSPKFNYFKLVWKTLGNLIVKVVTTPSRAIEGMKVDDNGNMFIEVDPDERDFTSEQFYQIDKVAELAKMDENVVLELNLVTRPTKSSKVEENHERRNMILKRHLIELGVQERQFSITVSEPDKEVKREGYVVTTKF